MTRPVLTHPSWNDISIGTAIIATKALRHRALIDWVVGLTRGGLIPAVLFSHIWNIPMMPVNYSSPEGVGDNKNHSNQLPDIHFPKGTHFHEGVDPGLPSLLLMDDICDSGHTLDDVRCHYGKQGYRVWTAALYSKEGASLIPDFTWRIIPVDSPWIQFPWEV